jgi:hypothetical protein
VVSAEESGIGGKREMGTKRAAKRAGGVAVNVPPDFSLEELDGSDSDSATSADDDSGVESAAACGGASASGAVAFAFGGGARGPAAACRGAAWPLVRALRPVVLLATLPVSALVPREATSRFLTSAACTCCRGGAAPLAAATDTQSPSRKTLCTGLDVSSSKPSSKRTRLPAPNFSSDSRDVRRSATDPSRTKGYQNL